MIFNTIEQALSMLNEMHMDVEMDHGTDKAWEYRGDLVRQLAQDCAPEVAEELARREGVEL